MRLSKGLKWLFLIGLLIVLFIAKGIRLTGGAMIRPIVLFSKYFRLMPYVYAQARHESNDFKSRVYLDNHNYFGMKWIDGRRGQVAKKGLLSPDGNFYAHYETDSSSILDLLKWFDYKNFPVSVKDANQYASELKNRNYYGDSVANYERALKFWINKS